MRIMRCLTLSCWLAHCIAWLVQPIQSSLSESIRQQAEWLLIYQRVSFSLCGNRLDPIGSNPIHSSRLVLNVAENTSFLNGRVLPAPLFIVSPFFSPLSFYPLFVPRFFYPSFNPFMYPFYVYPFYVYPFIFTPFLFTPSILPLMFTPLIFTPFDYPFYVYPFDFYPLWLPLLFNPFYFCSFYVFPSTFFFPAIFKRVPLGGGGW